MGVCSCTNRCRCTWASWIVSIIIGVVTAFLQITGTITVTTVFLWVTFGIAVAFLGIAALTADGTGDTSTCLCRALRALLGGALGTILLSVLLLAIGITATSIFSAILVGLLLFFFSLLLTSTACYASTAANCDD